MQMKINKNSIFSQLDLRKTRTQFLKEIKIYENTWKDQIFMIRQLNKKFSDWFDPSLTFLNE